MKKIVIFVHGEKFLEFIENNSLHKDYEKACKAKISWSLIGGHLNKDDKNFPQHLRKLQNADIFLCDSDNTNMEGEIENINFEVICHKNLVNALEQIKEKNPHLEIFIKNFPYIPQNERNNLANYGKIIESWFDDDVLGTIKK